MVAVFLFIWASDFLIHGVLLKTTYMDTASLWRTEEEMQKRIFWMFLSQLISAKFLTILFARGYENGNGVAEGFRFGFLLAPLMIAPILVQYTVSPIPINLIVAWILAGIVQTVGASMVAGAVYGSKSKRAR